MLLSGEVSKYKHIMLHYIILALKLMITYYIGYYVIRYFINWLLSHVLILIIKYITIYMLYFNFLCKYALLTKPIITEDKCSNLHLYIFSEKKDF